MTARAFECQIILPELVGELDDLKRPADRNDFLAHHAAMFVTATLVLMKSHGRPPLDPQYFGRHGRSRPSMHRLGLEQVNQ